VLRGTGVLLLDRSFSVFSYFSLFLFFHYSMHWTHYLFYSFIHLLSCVDIYMYYCSDIDST